MTTELKKDLDNVRVAFIGCGVMAESIIAGLLREKLVSPAQVDLPQGNRTTDQALITVSLTEHCVVITKDSDFVESFLLRRQPWKLLLVSTGNIGNNELLRLFQLNIDLLVESFKIFDFIELNRTSLICHL